MSRINHPIVGPVEFVATGVNDGIRLLGNWDDYNIVKVFVPQLKGVPSYGGPFSGNVTFYKKAVPQLLAAWEEVGRQGLVDRVLFWNGSFVPRMKRGSHRSPSEHTFGTAFDINAQWNGFRQTPAPKGTRGSVWELVPIFEAHGFECGARWKKTPDGMHFQIRRLLAAAGNTSTRIETPRIETPTEREIRYFLQGERADVPLPGAFIKDGKMYAAVGDVANGLGYKITHFKDRRAEMGRVDIRAQRLESAQRTQRK